MVPLIFAYINKKIPDPKNILKIIFFCYFDLNGKQSILHVIKVRNTYVTIKYCYNYID